MPEAMISIDDLEVFSRVVQLRLGARIADLRRIGRVQDVLRAADALAEALKSYSTHGSTASVGDAETSELDDWSRRLFAVFVVFAECLRSAAGEYRARVTDESRGLPLHDLASRE